MPSQSRRPPIKPNAVKEALPEIEPVSHGGPGELTDSAASAIKAEVAPAMSNAVMQDLVKDQAAEPAEDSVLDDLAGEVDGEGKTEAAPPPSAPAAPPPPPKGDGEAAPPAAPEKEEPEKESDDTEGAARKIAEAKGGEPLPAEIQEKVAEVTGEDVSDVRVHRDERAVESLDAGAAAIGKHVFLAPGKFDAASDDGKKLLVHEAAHAAGGSSAAPDPTGELQVGGTSTGEEKAAEEIADAAIDGETAESEGEQTAPLSAAGAGSGDAATIRRGEAGVHQNDITMPGMGVDSAHMTGMDNPNAEGNDAHQFGGWRHRDSENLSPSQRAALEVYAGNFMSDFSQANVPKAIEMMQNVPTMRGGQVTTIGRQGAGILLNSIVRAFAILELGTEAAAIVNQQTLEMYEAERHIDNPMGTSAADYSVPNASGTGQEIAETPPELIENPATAIQTTDPTPEQLARIGETPRMLPGGPGAGRNFHERRTGRDTGGGRQTAQVMGHQERQDATVATHQGSAVPGLQFDNPALFEVSDAGLGNHIYNSIEASKQSYVRAAQAGPGAIGRMHCGYADHIVQDYFSHSNFIEVALNSYIRDALEAREHGHEGGEHDHAEHDHAEHDHAEHDHAEHDHAEHDHADEGPDHDHASHDHGHGHAPHDKDSFLDAMEAQGPMARQEGVNDKVSPQFVATMFNTQAEGLNTGANGEETEQRDAITTGSFGASDTMLSLAHIFVPLMPKLHESMTKSIDTFMGLIETAPAGANWSMFQDLLISSGRDGAVLHTMIQGMSDAGIGVSVPNGVDFTWGEVAISPGWFGDPWTVSVPNGIGLTWADVPLTTAVGLFCGVATKVNELKGRLGQWARYIGLDRVANAIDRVWDAAMNRVKQAFRNAINKLVQTIMIKCIEEMRGTSVTPEEAAKISSGGVAEALEMANEALHGAEERTSIAYRLREGDLKGFSQAGSAKTSEAMDGNQDGSVTEEERAAWNAAQRQELVNRVGEVTGSGTEQDPWVPIVPLPPSHSEIGKDHPPHNPTFHEHHHQGVDHNPAILNQDSDPNHIFPDRDKEEEAERRAHEARERAEQEEHADEHEHETGGANGHDHSHGSSFFGLGIALAVEAQRHMYKQVELVWREMTGNQRLHFTDHAGANGQMESGADASNRRDSEMEVGHDQIIEEARAHKAREEERNQERGFRRAEDNESTQAAIARSPALGDLLAMVDLYVSHPLDSNWWRTVMDNYVSGHAEEVYAHIQRRNAMALSQERRGPGQ